jgi:predicted ferric reductase
MNWMMRGALWFGAYLFLILFPLVIGALYPGDGAGRSFPTQFGIACGFVALAIMAFEYTLVSKVRTLAGAFGQDALLQFHKLMAKLATLLLVLHVYLMIMSGFPAEFLNPFHADSPWALRWGVYSFYCLILLMALSLFRKRIGLAYDKWQLSHWLLADTIVALGLAHILLFAGFSSTTPMRTLLAVYMAIILAISITHRVIHPLRMWSRQWEVIENRAERGDSRTLVLAPVNHPGFTFEPGQYCWINTGKTPFHKDRHPISMSSCAYEEKGRPVAFTIRNLGDWSGKLVPALKPGDRVWLDGPHGVFSADRYQGMGYVLFGGGIGIAPVRSICLTLAERGDVRPVVLFFASRDEEGLTFMEDFEALRKRMNLTVVPVLSEPRNGWRGERGFLTEELVKKYLPKLHYRYQYFVCGPPPMMDAVEKLLPKLGVPPENIQSEHFDMV